MRRTSHFLLLLTLAFGHLGATASYAQQTQPRQGDAPSRPGFTFKQFSARHDSNQDGKVERDEFKGAAQFFRLLDQDGDGIVTAEEFQQSMQKAGREGTGRNLPEGVKILRDLEYAQVDGESLKLDLYVPATSERKPPLLVWIHGGGWTKGSKSQINPIFLRLTGEGYAAASVDYQLDGLNSHPKQIHDCKGAIRWLRGNAEKYGYDTTRIGVGGGSAGGHLVLLLGFSDGIKELEGDMGGNLNESSKVHAVVDLFGPAALELFAEKSERFRSGKAAELLKSASPVTYLSRNDPPILIFHGDKDQTVPLSQSEYLHKKCQEMGLESSLHIIEGAAHGGPEFSDPARYELIKDFFARHIKKADGEAK